MKKRLSIYGIVGSVLIVSALIFSFSCNHVNDLGPSVITGDVPANVEAQTASVATEPVVTTDVVEISAEVVTPPVDQPAVETSPEEAKSVETFTEPISQPLESAVQN